MPDQKKSTRKKTRPYSLDVYPRSKDEVDTIQEAIDILNKDENIYKTISLSNFLIDAGVEKARRIIQTKLKIKQPPNQIHIDIPE